MNIEIKEGIGNEEDVKVLFMEYTDMLIKNDSTFKEYLTIQNYDDEIAHLEHKYGRPEGRLYIVFCDGQLAGCVGLRKISKEKCELKRMYVREQFRGLRIGSMLLEIIIKDAKEAGYREMLLDTLPFLKTALKMYRKSGFCEIPCYNDSPMNNSIFMKLDLE